MVYIILKINVIEVDGILFRFFDYLFFKHFEHSYLCQYK
jgi:hypothetical protein